MTRIRRWLSRTAIPAFTWGEVIFIVAAATLATVIQHLAGISGALAPLVTIGLVTGCLIGRDIGRYLLRRKGKP